MNLTEACIRNPVMAWMLMAVVVLFGAVAWKRIGVSQFPDVDKPTISISVTWEGASPDVIEQDVVDELETELSQVESLLTMRSSSRQGSASIELEFPMTRDIDAAMQDVQAVIAREMRSLPEGIDPPSVSKSNTDDSPIMWLSLSGAFAPKLLSDTARYRIRDQLQSVPGVSEVFLSGWRERNVRVWIDGDRLSSRGLTIDQVIEALGRQHVELPAGQLEVAGRELNVRVMGEAFDLAALRDLVVATHGSTPVRLHEVALVEDGFADLTSLVRVNGIPSSGLGIRKQHGANAVDVAKGIYAAVERIQPSLDEGMVLQVTFDSTRFIEESMNELQFEIAVAVFLTAILCWLFLGSFSSTLNVILAIPMSLLGTIGVLYFLGMTLNTFTLLGLGLAVGLVVDDAIMVLENITRHREEGCSRIEAARIGTREITFAALASTLAVVAIFSPVLFMDDMIGRFFFQFGVALCVAILFSYVEAVTLTPARCAQFLDISPRRSLIGRGADAMFTGLARFYGRVLPIAIRHPVTTIVVTAGALTLALLVLLRMPTELVPSQDQSRLMVRVLTAVGTDVLETDRLMRRVEDYVNAQPEVQTSYTFVGSRRNDAGNEAGMYLTLVPPGQRTVSQSEFQQRLSRELRNYPGMRIQVVDMSQQLLTAERGGGSPVVFTVRGPDWDTLVNLSNDLMTRMAESGLMIEPNTDVRVGMPELRIIPDRERCADLGVPIGQVANAIQVSLGGVRAGKFSDDGRRMDIRVRLLADQRTRPEDLDHILLRTGGGDLVPLTALVRFEERPAMQSIARADRERAVRLWSNLAPGKAQGEALTWVREQEKTLPEGYRIVFDGASANLMDSMWTLIVAFIFGLIVSYMVLASQFKSLLHPLTVLSVLPPSISGAALALWATGMSINAFSVIGIMLLMGIAKKNSIILVDYTNQLRERGEAPDAAAAVLKAGPIRLRPILMTSGATAMAAVPLALALGPGGELRMPMAIAVIGGVVASTLLSLVVVPAVYVLMDRFLHAIGRPPAAGSTRSSEPAAELVRH
jgi:multidrug efflux pump